MTTDPTTAVAHALDGDPAALAGLGVSTPRTLVKRMWFPTHGRLSRRVAKRSENGWGFRGCVASGIMGLVLVHLVYEARS